MKQWKPTKSQIRALKKRVDRVNHAISRSSGQRSKEIASYMKTVSNKTRSGKFSSAIPKTREEYERRMGELKQFEKSRFSGAKKYEKVLEKQREKAYKQTAKTIREKVVVEEDAFGVEHVTRPFKKLSDDVIKYILKQVDYLCKKDARLEQIRSALIQMITLHASAYASQGYNDVEIMKSIAETFTYARVSKMYEGFFKSRNQGRRKKRSSRG